MCVERRLPSETLIRNTHFIGNNAGACSFELEA